MLGRGAHQRSTGELDGSIQLHFGARGGHNFHLRLLGLHCQWLGGFNSHLAKLQEPEASASASVAGFDNFLHNLGEMLLYLAREIEIKSVHSSTSAKTVTSRNFTECYDLQKYEISKTFCVEVLVTRNT